MTRPLNPLLGEIHILRDYPTETKLNEITDFEVWDGKQWIHAQNQPIYAAQEIEILAKTAGNQVYNHA